MGIETPIAERGGGEEERGARGRRGGVRGDGIESRLAGEEEEERVDGSLSRLAQASARMPLWIAATRAGV
jgi:hypothetical protein